MLIEGMCSNMKLLVNIAESINGSHLISNQSSLYRLGLDLCPDLIWEVQTKNLTEVQLLRICKTELSEILLLKKNISSKFPDSVWQIKTMVIDPCKSQVACCTSQIFCLQLNYWYKQRCGTNSIAARFEIGVLWLNWIFLGAYQMDGFGVNFTPNLHPSKWCLELWWV